MMWVARDMCEFFQYKKRDNNIPSGHVHQELICVKVYRGVIYEIVEKLNELRTIISLVIRIIIYQCIPIPRMNTI